MARVGAMLAVITGTFLLTTGPGVGAAGSAARITVSGGGTTAELWLDTGREESFFVSGRGRRVTVSLMRGLGVEGAVSEYSTEGRVTERSIHASFGKLGMVSVRLLPRGKPVVEAPPFNCEGDPQSATRGFFVGTIRFRSEDGAYDVDARRARGSVLRSPRIKCRGSRDDDPPANELPKEVVLKASDCHGRALVVAVPPDDPAFVGDESGAVTLATATERRGRIRISRFAFALSPRSPLSHPADLSTATLAAPNLFSGSAAFARGPDGVGAWTGTLVAGFPGRALEMAGTSFRASLRRVALKEGVFDLDYSSLCSR